MDTKLSVREIQKAIIRFNGGYNGKDIYIPNVSWGYFDSHEADLVQITASYYLHEYEIKRSYSDLLADLKKKGTHFENKVVKLYYVIPESIYDKSVEALRNHNWGDEYNWMKYSYIFPCGIITYNEDSILTLRIVAADLSAYTNRNKCCYKLFLEEVVKLTRLGCIRIWHNKEDE